MLANTIFEIIGYIENPILEKDKNKNLKYRIKKFLALFFIVFTVNICILSVILPFQLQVVTSPIASGLKEIIAKASTLTIYLVIFLDPLLKEIIFRSFLTKFKKHFKLFYYFSTILFALYQILDVNNINNNVILSFLLLLFGQLIFGSVLGFIRIKFGFLWAYALHLFTNTFSMLFLVILWW